MDENIGDTIIRIRKQQGISKRDLAKSAGVSYGALDRLEKYHTEDLETIRFVLYALGYDLKMTLVKRY